MLRGKKIIVGVTGSISAYKAALLVRLLVKNGAEVKVLMTQAATEFISPLTLSTLSKKPVLSHFVKNENGEWNNHVELGLWADAFLIAPASANTLGKCANGVCDNLLIATYLSARCPVFFAPAMDHDMWEHNSTQQNIKKLKGFGNFIIPPESGELASGLIGKGRLPEAETIVEHLTKYIESSQFLKGKKVLITAGPTYEQIDPVRFIGNNSSGKMGIALAEQAYAMGAEVHLVLGPSHLNPDKNIKTTRVKSAQQMFDAVDADFNTCDLCIMAAAVADYTPVETAENKIKKTGDTLELTLTKTKDILATMGKRKKSSQLLVGFALETNNEKGFAKSKLKKKNLDFIVLNSLNDKGAGFGHDTNKITILDRLGGEKQFPLQSKIEIARHILDYALNFSVEQV